MTPAAQREGPLLRLAPAVTITLMLGPVAAGLAGTLLPAFGYLPALGGTHVSLAPFHALMDKPGLARSLLLSLSTGLCATFAAFFLIVVFTACFEGSRAFAVLRRALSPVLAVPHAAAAFGLAFLVAPSGFAMRLVSPWATGFERPPDVLVIGDPLGLAMTAGLAIKEMPFLFLMLLAALPQTDSLRSRQMATSLGYRPVAAWLKTVLPRAYPQIRLPIFAVIAYSTSVVDVALILGPTTPAPLAVRLIGWMHDPDISMRFVASAGALLQLFVSAGAIGLWILGEQLVARIGRRTYASGRRSLAERPMALLAGLAVPVSLLSLYVGLGLLALWSLAGHWSFPDALPAHLTLAVWSRHLDGVAEVVATTLAIALPATLVALGLALACLERESRTGESRPHRGLPLLYIPLLVPQVAFLFGLQVLLLIVGLHDTLTAVALAHLVFLLPYVFLALSDPWRALDPRYAQMAAGLGASANRIFWRIRLPLLARAVAAAAALAVAVSTSQYLPTLLVGGGRVSTVTTEAVALAAGGNRRLVGIYALLQTLLPLAAFALAALVPHILFRGRAGMGNGG